MKILNHVSLLECALITFNNFHERKNSDFWTPTCIKKLEDIKAQMKNYEQWTVKSSQT